MTINDILVDDILYKLVELIKKFNTHLIDKYHLDDIPYNVSKKIFGGRIGSTIIEGKAIEYRWHGSGCTFFWDKLEIYFSVDAVNVNHIIITPGGWKFFLETFFNEFNERENLYKIDEMLHYLEKQGALINRLPTEGTFNLNEKWYETYIPVHS